LQEEVYAMSTPSPTPQIPYAFLDSVELSARWGRHPVSIGRYVKQGLLAPGRTWLGRRVWLLSEVLEAEARMMDPVNAPKRISPKEMEKVRVKGLLKRGRAVARAKAAKAGDPPKAA